MAALGNQYVLTESPPPYMPQAAPNEHSSRQETYYNMPLQFSNAGYAPLPTAPCYSNQDADAILPSVHARSHGITAQRAMMVDYQTVQPLPQKFPLISALQNEDVAVESCQSGGVERSSLMEIHKGKKLRQENPLGIRGRMDKEDNCCLYFCCFCVSNGF